jgi:acyl carrier protein
LETELNTPPISTEIIERVNALMESGFEIPKEKLVPGAQLAQDLGLDSLDAVDMLVYIEETLGVKVEGERLATVKTLADVYRLAADSLKHPVNNQ